MNIFAHLAQPAENASRDLIPNRDNVLMINPVTLRMISMCVSSLFCDLVSVLYIS